MRAISAIVGLSMVASLAVMAACTTKTVTTTTGGSPDGGKQNPTGTGTGTADSVCASMCATFADAKCKNDNCESDCEDAQSNTPPRCQSKADAVYTCAANSKNVSCDDSGKPALAAGECTDELTALTSCLNDPSGSGNDGGPSGTGGTCAPKLIQNASCDSCRKGSCCAESGACENNQDCLTIFQCISTNQCQDQNCITDCANKSPNGTQAAAAFYDCLQNHCASECSAP
jgi:hypothetical protein